MTPHSERPLRIMRIIARLNIGGPALHVTLLTEKLAAPDYESVLVCGQVGDDEGDMIYYAAEHGVEPIIVPELGRALHPVRDLKTLWTVYQLMRRFKPDVVHTHTAKAGFVGRVAAWLNRVPVIAHTYHGHVFQGYFSPAKTRFFLLLERITGWMSTVLITLTDDLRDDLADTYRVAPKDKFTVLPLGLDLAPFAAAKRHSGVFRAQWAIPADVPLVGIVGRMVPIKNHALFLEAAKRVKAVVPDAHFVIIGDGETRPAVEAQIAALGLGDCVTLTGWQQDIAPAFADMHVSVISSDNEGTPTSVIQSLTVGCPVVCTAVGGIPNLLDQGELGALVPPGDETMLADAIIRTIQTPLDTNSMEHAFNANKIRARYSVDRLVADVAALYQRLIA